MANNYLPATYQNQGWSYGYPQYGQNAMPYQQYSGMQQMSGTQGMKWVDGEVEAKGTPIPSGATQYAMWDINEPVIYIKSLNQMGMPNPLRKIHYTMDDSPVEQGGMKKQMSGEEEKKDTTQYARKDELQSMKEEIMQAIREMKPDNASSRRTATKGE